MNVLKEMSLNREYPSTYYKKKKKLSMELNTSKLSRHEAPTELRVK